MVGFRLSARPGVTLRKSRIQVDLIASLLIAFNPCPALHLPPEQIDLLKILPLFIFLHRELDQTRLGHRRHPLQRGGFIPAVAPLPAMQRGNFHPQQFGDPRDAKTLPVQIAGFAAWIFILKGKQMFFDVWRHNVLSFLPSA